MPTMQFADKPEGIFTATWKNASASVHRRFVKLTTGGVDYATADTDKIIGVTAESGVAQNDQIGIIPLIPGKKILVDCGGTAIAANAPVCATTAGEAVTITPAATKIMAGYAWTAGVANKVMTIIAMPGYTSA